MIKKLKHIIRGWYYALRGENWELSQQRMEQCRKCKDIVYLTKTVTECSICGCFLDAKTRVKEESCPQGK